MAIKIILAVIALAALALVYALIKAPSNVKIARSILIQALPEKVFPYAHNTRRIQEWNPFLEGDPSAKFTFAGPQEGVGAEYSWEGKKSGKGKATIIEVEVNRRVGLRLDFKKPFDVTNFGDYVLTDKKGMTEFTWTINETAFIPRALSVYINLDKLIGSAFEKGLTKLKESIESEAS